MFNDPESHRLLMIPGPIEFDAQVLQAMGSLATSHVDPLFIASFGNALRMLRNVFLASEKSQPFVVAGSGTLTWDMTAANLVEPGDNVLVVNTGIFGDWFAECLQVYGANVTQLFPPSFGSVPSMSDIEKALSQKKFKLVTITHVDTSSGVLIDAKGIAALVHRVSPETLIALDGVCSVGAEEIRMDEWGLDVVMTASQKAIGVPPGLAIMVASERAIQVSENRKAPPTTYFASWKKWMPIMKKYEAGQPGYFATPPVQLIIALEVSLKQLLAGGGMNERFKKHREASQKMKQALEKLGFKLVPKSLDIAANTLSAVYYPPKVEPSTLLKALTDAKIIVAGGLHPKHNTEYFRIGHMNISSTDPSLNHLEKVIAALESFTKGQANL